LCLFDAEAKQRRGRWHWAPLRQLLQCTKQVELWLALACVRMYTVWLWAAFSSFCENYFESEVRCRKFLIF
jgi:hypothetical protein